MAYRCFLPRRAWYNQLSRKKGNHTISISFAGGKETNQNILRVALPVRVAQPLFPASMNSSMLQSRSAEIMKALFALSGDSVSDK